MRGFLHQAVQLGSGCLVKAGFFLQPQDANGFQQPQRAHGINVGGVFRQLEAHRHMALGTQVVDFVGLGLLDNPDQVGAVAQVAVMQHKVAVVHARVLVDMVDTRGVEQAGAPLDAVHHVAFGEQEFSQIGAILASDAGDQGDFLGFVFVHVGGKVGGRLQARFWLSSTGITRP